MMSELAAFLVYCIGMSFTPGPNNLMSLSVSQKVGFKQAAPFLWGLFFSFFIIDGAAYFCSATLQELIPQLETPFKALGSLYILYLTYKIVKPQPASAEKEEKNIKSRLFISGFVLNLTNVKVMLFFLMGYMVFILPAFMATSAMRIVFTVFFWASSCACYVPFLMYSGPWQAQHSAIILRPMNEVLLSFSAYSSYFL